MTPPNKGFKPENHDDYISFKYEGNVFWVCFDEQVLYYISINYHAYSFDLKEEEYILKHTNNPLAELET